MTGTDIAWVAGLVEGEGTVQIPKTGQYPSVRVAMTDEDVVRRLQEVTGLGTIITLQAPKVAHHKQQWQWNVCSRQDVARLLCAITPMMGTRRRERIAEAAERLGRAPLHTGPQPTAPHGTAAAAKRHYRHGETPCEPCRLAINADTRTRAAVRKVAQ